MALCTLFSLTAVQGQTSKWERILDRSSAYSKAVSDAAGNVYIMRGYDVLKFNGRDLSVIGTISGEGARVDMGGIAVDAKSLYIGAINIKRIGTTKFPNANVIKWDLATRTWSALPVLKQTTVQGSFTYVDTLTVKQLADYRGSLYVQGSGGGSIYKLEGGVWKKMPGTDSYDDFLASDGSNFLYAVSASSLTRYNGVSWAKMGDAIGGTGGAPPESIAFDKNNTVYICGRFTQIGNTPVNYLAKWDGSKWVNAGSGITYAEDGTGTVAGCLTVASDQNTIYVGGALSKAGTADAYSIARWNGTQWSPNESGTEEADFWVSSEYANGGRVPGDKECTTLVFDKASSYLYAFCYYGIYRQFTKTITPPSVSSSSWMSMGKTLGAYGQETSYIRTVTFDQNGTLYVGGKFGKIGSTDASAVAKWDGTKWVALGSGLRGKGRFKYDNAGAHVSSLVFDGTGKLYAAATFTGTAATTDEGFGTSYDDSYQLARWDGSSWTALCQGCGPLSNLAFTQAGKLYAGTWGTKADDKIGILTDMNAKTYIPKELDFDARPNYLLGEVPFEKHIALDAQDKLYVTGKFNKAGSKDIGYIATWNGTDWDPLGVGLNNEGQEIIFDKAKNILYVGGSFSEANNINAYGAAAYNIGTKTWSALGVGYSASNLVFSKNGILYARVFHPEWGAYYFAKWNVTKWEPVVKADGYSLLGVDQVGNLYAITQEGNELFKWQISGTATIPATPTSTTPVAAPPASGKKFNGTSDVVNLPTSVSAGLSGGTAMTVEYWFKGSNLQSAVRLQSGGDYIVAGWGGTPTHVISTDQGAANGVKIKTGTSVNVYDGQWHHIAMTWDKGKADGFKSYVDGVLVDNRASANANLPVFNNLTPTVGAFNNNGALSEFTNGEIARIRIWKSARTDAQVREGKDKTDAYAGTEAGLLYQSIPGF